MAGSAREEAERLVAAVLARAVTGQAFGDRWATGDPECCVCPVCKAIAATRDPKPETAARLAGSAGDLAGSVAGLLRSVSAIVGERSRPAPPPDPPAPPVPEPNPDTTWSAATRTGSGSAGTPGNLATPGGDPWAAATPGGDPWAAATTVSDPWAAATTVSAAGVAADYAAELAERRAAALRAAAEAERRVAEAAALAKARRAAAAAGIAGDETGDTAGRVARDPRTPRRLDVWAAATADVGVASMASDPTVDHDEAGGAEPTRAGDGDTGDEARGGGAA